MTIAGIRISALPDPEGLDRWDIAASVGRSPRSVESKLARIRKKLARQLAVPAGTAGTVRPRYAEEGGDR